MAMVLPTHFRAQRMVTVCSNFISVSNSKTLIFQIDLLHPAQQETDRKRNKLFACKEEDGGSALLGDPVDVDRRSREVRCAGDGGTPAFRPDQAQTCHDARQYGGCDEKIWHTRCQQCAFGHKLSLLWIIMCRTRVRATFARSIANFAMDHGIDAYPAGRGIGHQVMVEEGMCCQAPLIVASDSHSNMYGGLGCLGRPS